MGFTTYEGHTFDYLDPRADTISITDILRALSRLNRFAGHTTRPYSVGEHSFFCLVMAEKLGYTPREQFLTFIHDFTEAYVGDCPAPLKELLPAYIAIEADVERAIYAHIGIEPPTDTERQKIHRIDKTLLAIEMQQLTTCIWQEHIREPIHEHLLDDEEFDLSDPFQEELLVRLLEQMYANLRADVFGGPLGG